MRQTSKNMRFNIQAALIFTVYLSQGAKSVETFRSIIPGGKASWHETNEYRDRSAIPRPPRQSKDANRDSIPHFPTAPETVRRVFVGFTDQGIEKSQDSSADKKGKIALPTWFSLPVGALVPLSFSERPEYDNVVLKLKKNSDVPSAPNSEKVNLPSDWTKRQNMPINSHSRVFLRDYWIRRKRSANKVSAHERKVQIIKAPDAKRSGLPKGQNLEGIMRKLQPGSSKKPDHSSSQRLPVHDKPMPKKEPVQSPERERLSSVKEDLEDLDDS